MPKTIKKRVPKKRDPETPEIEEIQSLFSKVFEERRKAVLTALAAIALIALVGVGLTMFQHRRTLRAAAMEAEGIAAFEKAARAEGEEAEALYREAIGKLEAAARLHETPSTLFYLAESHLKLGETGEAEAGYRALLDGFDDAPIAAAVAARLARIREAAGKGDEAEAILKPAADAVVGGDTALMDLVGIYDATNRKEEAEGLLRELVTAFPGSPWAADARARIEEEASPAAPTKDGGATAETAAETPPGDAPEDRAAGGSPR